MLDKTGTIPLSSIFFEFLFLILCLDFFREQEEDRLFDSILAAKGL